MRNRRASNPARWGIIADDLTGACDTGAIFAMKGFPTVVLLDRKLFPEPAAQVTVLTTCSRNDSIRKAQSKVRRACRDLEDRRLQLIYKKIDSTFQGHVFEEAEAAMAAGGFVQAIVCPAFPDQGRVVRGGVLFVRGKRLIDLSDAAQGCIKLPDSSLSSIGWRRGLGRGGPSLLDAPSFLIGDARTNQDLSQLLKAAAKSARKMLLVGSAGMAACLAEALHKAWWKLTLDRSPRRSTAPSQAQLRDGGSGNCDHAWPAVLTGSRNPVTERQIRTLALSIPEYSICQRGTLDRIAGIDSALAAGKPLVVRLPVHRISDGAMQRSLRELVKRIIRHRVPSIVLVGGDTAALVLRQLGTKAIQLHGEVARGIPWGTLIGGKADGMGIVTKAGGFGDHRSLIQAVQFLRQRHPAFCE